MTDVVKLLQDCLHLEAARDDVNRGSYMAGCGGNPRRYSGYGTDMSTDVSQSSTSFEMDHLGRVPTMSTGPDVR
jgi:hypothetical protein